MDNNVFEDNTSSSHSTTAPGAIYYTQDYTGYTLSITNSTFNRNTAYERGGAIQTVNGSISISDSTFADNGLNPADSCTTSTYACEGGTIYQYGYTLVLDNVTITGGDAIDAGSAHPYRYGGGLYIANVTSASLTDVTISDCNAYQGGGLYISGATTTVSMTNSLVEDSTASYGGGAYMSGGSLLTCTGSTSTTAGFLGNYGSTAGGGVYGGVRSTVCDWGATGTADDNTEGASFLTSDVYSGGRRSYGDDATF
jgi:predicted outer membrane repeat protein